MHLPWRFNLTQPSPYLNSNWARCWRAKGKFAAAAQELESAVRIQPDLAPALYDLSRVYGALGRKQRAAETMAQFLTLKAQETAEQKELGLRCEPAIAIPLSPVDRVADPIMDDICSLMGVLYAIDFQKNIDGNVTAADRA